MKSHLSHSRENPLGLLFFALTSALIGSMATVSGWYANLLATGPKTERDAEFSETRVASRYRRKAYDRPLNLADLGIFGRKPSLQAGVGSPQEVAR